MLPIVQKVSGSIWLGSVYAPWFIDTFTSMRRPLPSMGNDTFIQTLDIHITVYRLKGTSLDSGLFRTILFFSTRELLA